MNKSLAGPCLPESVGPSFCWKIQPMSLETESEMRRIGAHQMRRRGRSLAVEFERIASASTGVPRTVRDDAEACHDDPIAALSLNSQYASCAGNRASPARPAASHGGCGSPRCRTVHPRRYSPAARAFRSSGLALSFEAGGLRSRHEHRLFRRLRRKWQGTDSPRDGGFLLQLVEPRRDVGELGGLEP